MLDNLTPAEHKLNPPTGWLCTEASALQLMYDLSGAAIMCDAMMLPNHPSAPIIWSTSCDVGHSLTVGFSTQLSMEVCVPFLHLPLPLTCPPKKRIYTTKG